MKPLPFFALLLLASATAYSDDSGPVDPTSQRGCIARQTTWLPRWDQAIAEAARTGRPILLVFGVPAHEGTPGVW